MVRNGTIEDTADEIRRNRVIGPLPTGSDLADRVKYQIDLARAIGAGETALCFLELVGETAARRTMTERLGQLYTQRADCYTLMREIRDAIIPTDEEAEPAPPSDIVWYFD